MTVRIVCRGSSGSQLSIQCVDGSKLPVIDWPAAEWLPKLVVLFCLEKAGTPAGILPLAFSDMPLTCVGTASSTSATEEAREGFSLGLDWAGVGLSSWSLSSSSSPMANVESSSGTLLSVGVFGCVTVGLRKLSTELRLELMSNGSDGAAPSFLWRFRRSISSWPLSRVKLRNASNRFLFFRTAYMKFGLSGNSLAISSLRC